MRSTQDLGGNIRCPSKDKCENDKDESEISYVRIRFEF